MGDGHRLGFGIGASLLLAGCLALGSRASALAADGPAPAPAQKPPPYDLLRYREDWRPFDCVPPCDRPDLSDRLKAVPLSPDGTVRVDFGGQVRLRYEDYHNFAFGGIPDDDDGWLLARVRLHANVRVGTHVRLFVEGIYADQDTRDAGPRPVDENHGDLLNAFVEGMGTIGCGPDAGAWVGRRELLFGRQRVIGPLDWANTCRTFDGAGAWAKGSGWRVDGFVAEPVLVDADAFDESDDHTLLAGLYGQDKRCKDLTWEPYLLYTDRERATWLKVSGEDERLTVGSLLYGPFRGTRLDWELEGAYQVGTFDGGDVSAGSVSGEVGWKPAGVCWEPRLALGADWASGDRDGPGGDVGTYDQLFPTAHLWFGWADMIGRENLIAARLTGTAKPWTKVTVRADAHAFWRASTDDAVYNAAGGVLRGPSGSSERYVASELDLQVKWAVERHVDVEGGYSHMFAGTFLERTGAHEDLDFVYAMVTFTF